MTEPIVAVRDVFVAFAGGGGPVMALRGADLSLSPGERLLVQGPNGSGKSTLLRVITGEQDVIAGTVEVGGTPLHDLDAGRRRQWRARAVGFIDQHARRGLLPEQSVVDNVSLQLRLTGVASVLAERQARTTLARLGLESLASRTVAELSGGEAQRVATCAAVAHQPQLVLADEPTGELDEESAREVYDLLGAIAAEGTGVILVSHDPRSVAVRRPGRPDPGRPACRAVVASLRLSGCRQPGRAGAGQPGLDPAAAGPATHPPSPRRHDPGRGGPDPSGGSAAPTLDRRRQAAAPARDDAPPARSAASHRRGTSGPAR